MYYLKVDKTARTPFCFSGSKILLIKKNTRIRWAGNVARMWENIRAQHGGLVGKPEGKTHPTESRSRWGILKKIIRSLRFVFKRLIQFDLLRMSKILLETCTCRGL
jgi:hypothetical protein